jgi:hypothetical protein
MHFRLRAIAQAGQGPKPQSTTALTLVLRHVSANDCHASHFSLDDMAMLLPGRCFDYGRRWSAEVL